MGNQEVIETADRIRDGWFHERNDQWPGIATSLELDPDQPNLHMERSVYQDVICFKSRHHGNVLVLDGAIQCVEDDEYSYQEMITNLPMMSHPDPRNVLIIGGGDGGVLREVVKHENVEKADLCDIDEAVPRLSRQYLPQMAAGLDHPKSNVMIGDGLRFIKSKKNEYDVIITDSSDPDGPAKALFQKQYFQDCYDALRDGGVLSTQAESFWNNRQFIADTKKELKEVFPVVEWAWSSTPTYPSGSIGYFVATKDPNRNVKEPVRTLNRAEEEKMFKYYNKDVHSASFVLPTIARRVIGYLGEDIWEGTTKFGRPEPKKPLI